MSSKSANLGQKKARKMKNKLQHVKSYVRVKPKRKKDSELERSIKSARRQVRKALRG